MAVQATTVTYRFLPLYDNGIYTYLIEQIFQTRREVLIVEPRLAKEGKMIHSKLHEKKREGEGEWVA